MRIFYPKEVKKEMKKEDYVWVFVYFVLIVGTILKYELCLF